MRARDRSDFSLYGTAAGVQAVRNPVRRHILQLLEGGEMSFDAIVSSSGRAKSTVSAHLSSLADEGIVGSRPGMEDERKKYFFLTSHFIGELQPGDRIADEISNYACEYREGAADPFHLYKLIYRTFRVSLLTEGISLDPLLRRSGEKVGGAVYPAVAGEDMEEFCQNLANFWDQHRLGRMEILSQDPIRFSVYDCFECVDLPQLGKPACSFDSGLLSLLFSRQTGSLMNAFERECYAAGDPCCTFEILPVPEK
ncbi:V4R domain-containing protein [Methanocalculus sp.]|uniref:V4R domain-containing protein n=1 Tax=Methanocalculus sp. TaxID=2004547 RepID=UPI00260ABE0B|nr:V4R domain-containing protein [Methanocalculus sp.]MDG6249661.1 ArsR family transcriptional regulator [Methanocalculus sp.]